VHAASFNAYSMDKCTWYSTARFSIILVEQIGPPLIVSDSSLKTW